MKRLQFAPVGFENVGAADQLAVALNKTLRQLMKHAPDTARQEALVYSGALIEVLGLESFLILYGVEEKDEVLTLKEGWTVPRG